MLGNEMFDLAEFVKTMLFGSPLMFVILGIVQWAKALKKKDGTQAIQGNGLLILSLLSGLIMGTGWMVAVSRPPAGSDWYLHFVYWFGTLVYSLSLGFIASGLYKVIKDNYDGLLGRIGYDPRGEG